jgi:enoyl-CoA hydratase
MSVKYGEIATVGKVKAEIRERVAVVTLADPPGNGVGLQVTNRILELLDEYEQNETVRCVLFTHEGDDFSKSGAGAEEFTLIDQGKSMVEVSGTFRPSGLKLVGRIDTYPKPTIAVGKGLCLGAAYSLFSCCDIRIAGSSLRLYNPDFYMGIASDWGLTGSRLPIWLGRNRMMDLTYFGEEMSAEELYHIGAVTKVVPDEQLSELGWAAAKKMSTASPTVVKYFKQALRRAIYNNLEENVAKEVEDADIVLAMDDSKYGSQAFSRGELYDWQCK